MTHLFLFPRREEGFFEGGGSRVCSRKKKAGDRVLKPGISRLFSTAGQVPITYERVRNLRKFHLHLPIKTKRGLFLNFLSAAIILS